MKPDWKYAPEWAKYLAQDLSGIWFWYEQKPKAGPSYFVATVLGRHEEVSQLPNPHWKSTLEARPQ